MCVRTRCVSFPFFVPCSCVFCLFSGSRFDPVFRRSRFCSSRIVDPIRLIEYFDELARIDTNLNGFRHKLTRDHFTEIQMEILLTIDFQFPRYTPHLFISYFIRFLSSFRFFFFLL